MARFGGATMGTTWTVQCMLPIGACTDGRDAALLVAIEAVLDDVIAQMSNWRADSAISGFNCARAQTWVALPGACFAVVEAALAVARASGGAYDPTIGPLVDLWGFGPAPRRADDPSPCADDPSPCAVEAVRSRCGWRRIEYNRVTRELYQPGGCALDLCSIAKGYAVDAVCTMLAAQGIAHCLVEIGGELRGAGVKSDGLPWWVELEAATCEGAGAAQGRHAMPAYRLDVVALHGLAVASSGDYRRYYFNASRQRRSHTIDPRTGYPASHGVAGVTVLHESCMLADAWSTALTVLGPAAGMRLAQREALAARFVVRTDTGGFRELVSPAYAAMLE